VLYSKLLLKYGTPVKEYRAADEGCISIEDHFACQSNHKYLEASLFRDIKNGISKNGIFKELLIV